jgi:5'(3')-deoxyribonucleotidase
MSKKILYLDMDGVIADFDLAIKKICPELETSDKFPDYESRSEKVDEIVENNLDIFYNLTPIEGAVDAVNKLFEIYDVYFLSTPMWSIPESFIGKRVWIEKQFGDKAKKRLILTHRKDLNIGHFLVDDRLKNGASEFNGEHIHFATDKFPNWSVTIKYLEGVAG